MKAVPGEAGAGIEAGSGDGPGQLPAGMGGIGLLHKTRGLGGGEEGRGCPSAASAARWDQSGGGKAAAWRGWKAPTRFNPSLAKPLPLHGGKPPFIREQSSGEWGDVTGTSPVLPAQVRWCKIGQSDRGSRWRGDHIDFIPPTPPPPSSGAPAGGRKRARATCSRAQQPAAPSLCHDITAAPGEGGGDPAGSCGLGWGRAPRPPPARPLLPRRLFISLPSDSLSVIPHNRRFLPGQVPCPMAPTGVPHGPSPVKCSSRHLVRGKTLSQSDILSQVLPSST